MKRIFSFVAACATMFALAACQEELQQPVEEQKPVLEGIEGELQEVTFSVNLEDKAQTKAISDGLSADQLEYAVYYAEQGTLDEDKQDVNHSSKYKPGDYIKVLSTGKNAKIEKSGDRTWKVTLTLAKNVKYDIVFWAYAEGAPYTFYEEDAQIIVDDYEGAANAEIRDAFYGICKGYSVISSDERVELRRPFAQINFGACDYIPYVTDLGLVVTSKIDTEAHEKVEAVYEYDDPINGRLLYAERPAVAECKVPNTLNVLDGSVSGEAVVKFQLADIPFKGGDEVLLSAKNAEGETIPYHWMGMNYILAGPEATINNIHATFHYNGQDLVFDVPNVPYKRNFKTNIIGNLFTENAKFNVVVLPDYFTPDIVIDLDELEALNPIERAIKLAVDGKLTEASVVLSADLELEETITVPAGLNLVLDLGGKTLTSSVAPAFLANGNVTMSNGNAQVAGEFVRAGAGAQITLTGVKAVSGTEKVPGDNCVFVPKDATGAKVVVGVGTELKSYGAAAIQSNGNTQGLVLTVAGKVESVGVVAMYLPQVATCTIEDGAVISGATGIELRAGDLVVKDGAKISADDDFETKANGNGSTVLGAAVAVSAHSTNLPINVTIEGGEFSCAFALYEVNFFENRTAATKLSVKAGTFNAPIYSENCTGFITGGTFAEGVAVPAEYLAEGLIVDGNGEVVEKLIATLTKITEGPIPAEGGVVKVKVTVSKDVSWVISHNNVVKKAGNTACDSEIEITIKANETQQEVEHTISLAAPANVSAANVTYIQEAAAAPAEPEFEGGKFWIVADGKYAMPLSSSYGYLKDPDVQGYIDNAFTFSKVDGGFTIQDATGKYYYMNGDYDTFNTSTTLPEEGAVWTVEKSGDDTYKITNVLKQKFIQFDGGYGSFASYAEMKEKGVIPTLIDASAATIRPVLTLSETAKTVEADATEYTFAVNANVEWTATPSAGVTLAVEGSNVTMTFEANTAEEAVVHTVKVAGEGLEATFTLTQKGVPAPGEPEQTLVVYNHTFKSGELKTSASTAKLSGINWDFSGATYIGWDSNGKGIQLGSKNNPAKNVTLSTSAITGPVNVIKVNSSVGSGGDGKLAVYVGGVQYGNTVSLTANATEYTFDIDGAQGEIEIIWTNTSKAMYVKSISVEYLQ